MTAKGLAGKLVPAVVLSTVMLSTVVGATMATATTATTAPTVEGASARTQVKRPTTAAAVSLITRGAGDRGAGEVRAADGLRASLSRSDAAIATASLRLRVLSAQAGPLVVNLSATRTAQATAENDATVQGTRLVELGSQVQLARSALEHSAINSYVGGGGPLGEMAVALESLAPSPPHSSINNLATVNFQVNLRAQLFNRAKSARSAQVTRSKRAMSVSKTATAAATTSARAESAHDSLIAGQQRLSTRLRAAQTAQVVRAAGVRRTLLRAGDPVARAADRQLARVLKGRDYKLLMARSSRCGKGSPIYANGKWPPRARCALYAAPDQTLRRAAAFAFNRMSNAYQRQTGSALCVTEGYRSYAEQVAVKRRLPGLAATPGTSKHGLGLAVDLCGGVQDFANPAHQWLRGHARHFGWVHPAWAEPSGGLPEPWHWEFAG
jgi:LAS superfamily LD-carboxypeptidase LdcB